jgi:hypothetical protein
MFSADLLTSHPPEHANGLGLRTKAVILLRKVTDYTRSMDVRGIQDLRQDPVFVELDRVIMRFGCVPCSKLAETGSQAIADGIRDCL